MRLRADLQEMLDALEAADREADSLAGPLGDEAFQWRPDGGRGWSVAQCLDHLATANEQYGARILRAIEEARAKNLTGGGPIAPGFFGRRFVASLEPPVRRRTRAPGAIQPRSTGSRADIMRAYHDAHDKLRGMVRSAADIDVNRASFQNPFLKYVRVRVGTGFRIIAAHDRRHLWQARQVIKAMEAATQD